MKKTLVIVSALLVTAAFGEVKKAKVFVDDLVPNAGCEASVNDLQMLHDKIVGNVVSSRKYEVVERRQLAQVQKELKLVDAGLTEGDAPESNKLKAAGYCVYGKVVQFRSNAYAAGTALRMDGIVELQLRITNIESGRLLAAKTVKTQVADVVSTAVASTRDPKKEALTRAIDRAAKEVVAKLNDVAFPVYVLSVNSRFVTANVAAEQVTEGEVWEAFALGDDLVDPQTGEAMGQDEELVGRVVVSRPGAKTTKFAPESEKDAKAIREAWEEATELANESGKKNVPKMVLHKAPEKVAKPVKENKRLPDMSAW